MLIVVGLIIAMIGAELVLRRFWPLADPYADDKLVSRPTSLYVPRVYSPNYSAEIRVSGVSELPASGRLTANSLGMRTPEFARGKPLGVARIVLVGGSAMDCWFLSDEFTVRARLEQALQRRMLKPVEVIFAGGWAARSYDHVASLGHRVFHLDADLVVLAGGIGDLFEALRGRDYLLPAEAQASRRMSARRLCQYLVTEVQLGRLAHKMLAAERPVDDVMEMTAQYAVEWLYRSDGPISRRDSAQELDVGPYRENLVSAVGMATGHRIPIILSTQPTRFGSDRPELGADPYCVVNGTAISRSELAAGAREFNDATRDVAMRLDVPLCDLAQMFDDQAQYFFDDFHYGSLGAAATAQALADFIAKELPVQLPPSPAAMYSPRHR